MKTITSKTELLKKLKKENLLSDGHMFYLTDFHHTKVGQSVANKLHSEGLLEPASGGSWFEKCWRLRKPIEKYHDVEIYHDQQNMKYFFSVKKGKYIKNSLQSCRDKLDYLKAIGEKLK